MAKCERINDDCPYWMEQYGKCELNEIRNEPCPNPKAYTFVTVNGPNDSIT